MRFTRRIHFLIVTMSPNPRLLPRLFRGSANLSADSSTFIGASHFLSALFWARLANSVNHFAVESPTYAGFDSACQIQKEFPVQYFISIGSTSLYLSVKFTCWATCSYKNEEKKDKRWRGKWHQLFLSSKTEYLHVAMTLKKCILVNESKSQLVGFLFSFFMWLAWKWASN